MKRSSLNGRLQMLDGCTICAAQCSEEFDEASVALVSYYVAKYANAQRLLEAMGKFKLQWLDRHCFRGWYDAFISMISTNNGLNLPVAKLPRLDLLPYVFGDALEIAFVVVALHLSMCKVFNRKMGTKTDNNMELYALGLMGSLSSFFNTYPISSSIGRSMLNVECGAKTQLSALFTAMLLLIVILFLGPLLSALPMCVLAVIIIYSMKSIFQKMPYELFHLWRVSKIDFLIWVVTFVATVVLNVMQGLAVAVAFALLTTVFRIQWPRWHLLSKLNGTEDYRDCGRYSHVTDVDSVRIFRFDAPLLFTNAEHFANSARRAVTTMDLNCLNSTGTNNNNDVCLKNLEENGKIPLTLPNANHSKKKSSQVSASSSMAKGYLCSLHPKMEWFTRTLVVH